MQKYNLYQIDSFTKKKFLGNPAGVVSNADGLTEQEMQKIARELNNSETAFILPPNVEGSDVQVRFFTPLKEVPICGHATIAAHYVLALEKNFKEKTCIKQSTKAGVLPVDIEPVGEKDYKITMTQGKVEFLNEIQGELLEKLLSALGIKNVDLINNAPVQVVSTGHSKVMIGIKNYSQLHNLKPNMKELALLSEDVKCNGYFIFTFDTEEEDTLVKGRMFAPAIGIDEDPVTGNANGPVGAYIVKYKLADFSGNTLKFKGKQGLSIGRDGEIEVEVTIENDEPVQVKVSGSAVCVFKCELEL